MLIGAIVIATTAEIKVSHREMSQASQEKAGEPFPRPPIRGSHGQKLDQGRESRAGRYMRARCNSRRRTNPGSRAVAFSKRRIASKNDSLWILGAEITFD